MNEPGNSRRVQTHAKNSGETIRRLGTIIQSIFCAQSGTGIRLNRYPGARLPVLENFHSTFSPDPTDFPWVSEDDDTAFLTFSSFTFLASFFFLCLVGYISVENVFRKAFRVLELMKGKGDGRWKKIFAFTLYSYCLFSDLLDWIVEASMTERLTPRTLDLEVRGSSLTRRVFVSLDKELYSSLSLFT